MKHTIRTRLTLTYATLMLLFATSVTVSVYLFMRYAATYDFSGVTTLGPADPSASAGSQAPTDVRPATAATTGIVVNSASDLLTVLLVVSVIALLVLGCAAAGIGWIVTGRLLRPLHDITAAARRAGGGDLGYRIALAGPQDELKDLSDTFDTMLARLERAFQANRRFAANASHELRTPLATTQAVLDVVIADPDGQDVRALALKLRAVNTQSVEVVDALLDLADLNQSSVHGESVVLSDLVREAAASVAAEAKSVAVHVDLLLDEDCVVMASPTLLRQLVLNLLQNAVRHNVPRGTVTAVVTKVMRAGSVTLVVRNTGRPVSPDVVPLLTEPFYRGAGRTSHSPGSRGLGLAIAESIAAAHGTQLRLTANQSGDGGLTAELDLPLHSHQTHR